MKASLITICLIFPSALVASDEDGRFMAGLRERRLFSLAETYCQARLKVGQIGSTDRAELTVELIRTLAEHAMNSRGSQRDQLWQQARDVATSFNTTERPRAVLVRVQDALTVLARGELSRMESEVSPMPDESLTAARETLREAASALTSIDRELTETIPIQRRNPLRPDELSAEELTSLQNHVRYQLARTYKNQALCFPPASSDRTASLTAAIDQLQQPLLQLAPGQSLYVDLRLEQIACLRLLGDLSGAAAYLKALSEADLSPQEQLSVQVERIRWQLAKGQANEALKVVTEGRTIASVTLAELDFAFLETYVSLWKSAADGREQEDASRWRDKSIATAKFVEQEHGAYWARRAEILLVRIGAGSGDGSVDILRRTADDLYRKGNLDDAITAYDKAAAAAINAAELDQSFELAYKAALVLQQQQKHPEAATRFQKLALAQKSHAYAANSHLLAIANTRQASAAAGKWLESYPELLQEHLANWPNSDSASTAAFWLGEFETGWRSWQDAIEAFSKVRPESEHFTSSVKELGECWLMRLESLRAAQQPITEELQRADDTLRRAFVGDEEKLPTEWSPAAREAVLALAKIRLRYGDVRFAETESFLKAALAGSPEPSDAWRVAAESVLVGIVARQPGREADAREMLAQVGAASTNQLFALFQQIALLMEAASGSAQMDLAKLVADVAKRLDAKGGELDAAQSLLVDQTLAKALEVTGDVDAAYELFSRLAKEHSGNAAVQEDFGRFLLASDNEAHWQQALDQWRRVAARTRPRTNRWFYAKYSVALAQYKLNDKQDAAKLIRYLQATEDLSQSELEQEFSELLARCIQ
ncbi:MAG: hypothetical protein H6823_12200 [Planctomycetaceae bacterium]|nr:hypothetical protein [Planctomycetaceae bacterium]